VIVPFGLVLSVIVFICFTYHTPTKEAVLVDIVIEAFPAGLKLVTQAGVPVARLDQVESVDFLIWLVIEDLQVYPPATPKVLVQREKV
jgi:hypothetical protein